jgi:hypothetical protein
MIRRRKPWAFQIFMTWDRLEFPVARLRVPAHAITEYRNGRKRDKLFLLTRASSPPRGNRGDSPPGNRNPAEPEASISRHALRFPPGSFCPAGRAIARISTSLP